MNASATQITTRTAIGSTAGDRDWSWIDCGCDLTASPKRSRIAYRWDVSACVFGHHASPARKPEFQQRDQTMVQRAFKLFGILLLAPAILVLSALILIALLGIFVVWLTIVGVMAAGLVISDLTGALRPVPGTFSHRPLPAGK
jgi:hypothetical protein